jgi:hypothetical protein
MTPFPIDQDGKAQAEHFAVVQTKRTDRKRYPEGCISLVASGEEALAVENPDAGLFAALLYGPSVSSESQRIYFLVRWLGAARARRS